MKENIIKEQISRYKGAMIGLAVGDALGAPVEFLQRDKFPPVEWYCEGGKFKLSIGEYTDDTAMALCLAQSLIDCKGLNQKDQLQKYLLWFEKGYMSATGKSIGCGKTVYRALLRFKSKNCEECGNKRFSKGAGNGSIMRIAPIALFYANDLILAMKMAEKSSYTTHGLKICADACRVYTGLIIGALKGIQKENLLSNEYFEYLCKLDKNYIYDPLIKNVMQGSYKTKKREDISSSGYVVHTLEAALWAFYNSVDFNEGVLKAVNLGNDADTVGAVFGQLAGAYYGINGIEKSLRENLCKRKMIEEVAIKLFKLRY